LPCVKSLLTHVFYSRRAKDGFTRVSHTNLILEIDGPHFTIKLYDNLIVVDLKGDARNEVEKRVEKTSVLGKTIGAILNIFAPLHIRLSEVASVSVQDKEKVKIVLPHHRDIIISLKPKDAENLVDKLNKLIPIAKQRELERIMREHKLQRIAEEEHEQAKEKIATPFAGGPEFPIVEPAGVLEEEKQAEQEMEEKEEKED
jgi:hypothetical protein